MSTTELTLLFGRIDRTINDLIDINAKLEHETGRSAFEFDDIVDISHELKNNARRAVYGGTHHE